LTEDAELQEIEKMLQVVHDKAQTFKELMSTLPPVEKMEIIAKDRKLYSEMDQMMAEQQAHAHNIETLQGEEYKVTKELAAMWGMVKQVVQESAENLKTHITAEMVEGIV